MMQLEPPTALDCGIARYDALANVQCGSRTLARLIREYGLATAIAAYNFGAGNVSTVGGHLSRCPIETQRYVRDVLRHYDTYQHEALTLEAPPPTAAAPSVRLHVRHSAHSFVLPYFIAIIFAKGTLR
jgi:hypothetical protein